eukprot:CAMPEP_0172622164 /NCGR_PEP_ID=MMETSP1068-20121228/118477_1 /TAXON_ID=35684 /ORGANISM="Pseudopedinella elastica, Strain CCMP716" /LENGTH=51 /DNA_ID=CAMNT_0013430241 /DNA_START=28 /DNA_END=179 /DNA_ORIENTATION=+
MAQYLVTALQRGNPDLLDFAQDFEVQVQAASKIHIGHLNSEVASLASDLDL